MKVLQQVLLIFIFETLIFWIFIRYFYIPKLYENPEFISLNILLISVAVINLIILGILFFYGKSNFKIAILCNIFLAPLVLFLVSEKAFANYTSEFYISRYFKYQNKKYNLFIDKKKEKFLVIKTDKFTNASQIVGGKIEEMNEEIILILGKEKFVVENDSIKGIEGKVFKLN